MYNHYVNSIGGGPQSGAPVSPITGNPRSSWSQALHEALMNWVPGQSPHPLSPQAQMKYDPVQGQFVSTAPPPPEWNPYQNVMDGKPAGYPMAFDKNGMIPNMQVPQAPQIPPNPAQNMAPVSQTNPAMPTMPTSQTPVAPQMPQMPNMPTMPQLSGPASQTQGRMQNWPNQIANQVNPNVGDMWKGMPPYMNMMNTMTAGKYLDQLINKAPVRL